ncbi:hypothetical protein BKA67DRAFT_513481 [Truncatella angustata]|uniref:Zn(2)-C6 fungal-type domain-containing protein n=1 Tax=Truncatella angustata TaxID=152316 RepID=A0A9P8UT71_9PEZI|nr:uncharacterized protein BKA67DRAFT_513481 [Truncatella angustata]KAH6657866.1 hypothetical protein BKA67DRAFT_513481 [Truncatella angustata]
MDAQSLIGAASASLSPTSPVSVRHGPSIKRKRSLGGLDSSPGSDVGDNEDQSLLEREKKRQPGVKRACNECRQQKLRCDVVQDPFASCSRCNRLKLECKIESNFKRIGKRSKHAEMEKEIDRLRRNINMARQQGFAVEDDDDQQQHSQLQSPIANSAYSHTRNPSLMGSDEAVNSLLTLKRGGSYSVAPTHYAYELETVRLTDQDVSGLFQEFFAHYHPFLPFLHPEQPPDLYFQQHALLFWTIIAIASRRYRAKPILHELAGGPFHRLLWGTVGDVPNSYFVVKALCLICTWPLPTSTTTADPTHILCGVMMKAATGIGLHRPSHTQDFSRVSVELNKEQLHDRVTTWAVCNIVAQHVGTGYGQPASSLYDWTLAIRPGEEGPFTLSTELAARLRIERFCDKVSKEMYSNASDPRGVAGDEHRAMLMRVYRRDYQELQASIMSQHLSPIVEAHLKAAAVHLRLAGFFDSSKTPGYMDDLMGLWRAITSFLDLLFLPENEFVLLYSTNYVQQMLVAAGFALLKLMRSFFVKTTSDFGRGRELFHKTILGIRKTSIQNNDLQWRLAELMVQMWNGAKIDQTKTSYHETDPLELDDSLQLKVRCRHSMSLVYDSIWRWREDYQAQGRGTLDSNESSASSTHLDSTLMAPQNNMPNLMAANGALTPNANSGVSAGPSSLMAGMGPYSGDPNYDFFDPQHWMLDGLLDFNYNYPQPLEGM